MTSRSPGIRLPEQNIMRAKKSLGQNFLRDERIIERIVAALSLSEGITVVEIGPGRGALTEKLIDTGADVVAIEIDRLLVPALRTQFHHSPNFRCIEADVLQIDFATTLDRTEPDKTRLVGNLPYYISTAILQKLTAERSLFSNIVFMLQREVVDRIAAGPGNSERGFLTVLTESAFTVERLFDVPPEAFTPQPKVWSSIVALTPKPPSTGDAPGFRRLVSAAFAQKRKTLLNNLKHYAADAESALTNAAIDPRRRAETLNLDEWYSLFDRFKTAKEIVE